MLFAAFLVATAQEPLSPALSIEGNWTTFDDTGRTPRAIVAIAGENEHWTGHVIEIFRQPGEPDDPKCDACTGPDRGANMRGLKILDVERTPPNARLQGRILDPEAGITYRCVVTLEPNGRRLKIRAYIGTPLIGRDVVWERATKPLN